jgi:hypothetical protein
MVGLRETTTTIGDDVHPERGEFVGEHGLP